MAGTNANVLTNPAVSASGQVDNLLIEKFTGIVHEQFLREERFESHFSVQDVTGTNMVTNKSVGDTQLQKLVPGQEPDATSTEYDNHSLVVDTVILARNTIAMLHDIQSDIQVQQRLAKSQAKQLVKFQDEVLLTQIIKGAQATSGRVSGMFGGNRVDLAAANDEKDSAKYLDALEALVLQMNEHEVDNMDLTFVCPWEQYYVLMDDDHLTNADYATGNGGKMTGTVIKAYGFAITPTNRIHQEATGTGASGDQGADNHFLSNSGNSFRYNTLTADAGCVGLLFGHDALLVGRTMGVQSDIYFNKRLKTYFIDSWFSFGCIADRYEFCGAIHKAAA